MKIILVLIVIILIVAAMYYHSTTTKNWFNAKGEYPQFPFKFKIFNRSGYEITNTPPAKHNSSALDIRLNEFSQSIPPESLGLSIHKNIGELEYSIFISNHPTSKNITLDSKVFKIAEISSSSPSVVAISIPINQDFFQIEVSGQSKDRINEIVAEIEKSFKFLKWKSI